MSALREGSIPLPDGRRLGYAEYGRRGGVPVLLFHGLPGGRALDHRLPVAEAGAWLFVLERPSFGLSDRQPGRRLLDWPLDVAAFVNAFGIHRFAVVGVSAGAPYALACGHVMPDRVTVIGLLAGFVPFVATPGLDALLPPDWRQDRNRFRSDPEVMLAERLDRSRRRCADWVEDQDRVHYEVFGPAASSMPEYGMRLLAATCGGEPDTDEDAVQYSPWGFDVEQVPNPIRAWHGDADDIAPMGLIEGLVSRAFDATLTVCPGEGHFLDPSHGHDYLPVLTTWQ